MGRKLRDLLSTHPPPGVSPAVHRAMGRTLRPVEAFLHTEVAGGVALLVASVVALVWANSPWSDTYHALWSTPAGVSLGDLVYQKPLRFWIDEVLMTLFFFVVGLEIRREIAGGELSDRRRAALPLAAALGGMIVPALVFIALNHGRATSSGWGVPMATDIAFALGALTLLGSRVPPALRVLLLALAVIDDVGAILVIGVFYSSGVELTGLALAAGGVLAIVAMQRAGLRRPWVYVVPGVVVWEGIHSAGVHATLAGVIIGLLTPARAWLEPKLAAKLLRGAANDIDGEPSPQAPSLDRVDEVRREATSPVDSLTHLLHQWVAFGVMPLFALANAGVTLGTVELGSGSLPLIAGIVAGLVLGKPIGIVLGALLAVKLGLAGLPRGVTWRGVTIVGCVAGVGFTMSLFIAELAFGAADLEAAKLAILVGSITAVVLALVGGRALLSPVTPSDGAASTESEAETSTEQ